jgi:hypothetical protein
MSVVPSLDDVARTSDDAAVRAHFDAATLSALRLFSIIFFLTAFPHLAEATTVFRIVLAFTAIVAAVLTMVAVRKKATNRLARFVKARPRGAAMVVLVAETALLVTFHADLHNPAMLVFAMIASMMAIFFRLLPAEHFLLHGSLSAIALTAALFWSSTNGIASSVVAQTVMNVIALVVAQLISRRVRRRVTDEWIVKRASAREQIRMRDELRYARELQLSMLPECAPSLDWADVCSISIPASEVGGDYYDYFVASDHMALVCGDVAGHGMASGLVLAALRGGFALLRDSLRDPAHVLARLHDVVAQTSRRRMLVTLTIVLLDRKTRRAIIASAGHPPVLVRRADGSVSVIELFAPPLGVRLPIDIPQVQFDFQPGDVFILHSDGIYEARDASEEVYGFDRLERVVKQHGDQAAEAIRNAILTDLAEFRGAREQDDDVTIVVCRIR